MKNRLFGVIIIILLLSCNSTKQLRQTANDLLVSADGLTFSTYYSKHEIPKVLYSSYRKFYDKGMSMADKDGEFNPFDEGWKGVPGKRFIFGANSVSNVYQLFVYEEGGGGLKNYCIVSKKEEGGEGSIVRVYLFGRASNINELKEIISKKEYRISNL